MRDCTHYITRHWSVYNDIYKKTNIRPMTDGLPQQHVCNVDMLGHVCTTANTIHTKVIVRMALRRQNFARNFRLTTGEKRTFSEMR